MAQQVARIRSPWTQERLFAYMADLRNFKEWDPGIKEARLVAGEGPGTGAAYELTVGGVGRDLLLRYETEAFEPPSRLVVRARTPSLLSLDEIRVVPLEGGPGFEGSVLSYSATLELRGLMALGAPLLPLMLRRIVNRAADSLARIVEGERVQ